MVVVYEHVIQSDNPHSYTIPVSGATYTWNLISRLLHG